MPKVKVKKVDWFPIRQLDEERGDEIEVPDEQLTKWRKAFEEFERVQNEIDEVLELQIGVEEELEGDDLDL